MKKETKNCVCLTLITCNEKAKVNKNQFTVNVLVDVICLFHFVYLPKNAVL